MTSRMNISRGNYGTAEEIATGMVTYFEENYDCFVCPVFKTCSRNKIKSKDGCTRMLVSWLKADLYA